MNNKILDECIKRMQMLKLDKPCIEAFKQGNVWESEGFGALYEVNEQEQSYIDEFETEHTGCKVYHMIHNMLEFGECYSILYVSSDTDEWEQDIEDIENGYAFVYVKNVDDDWCSEFGTIAIKSQFGGLVRLS
jgi:ferredoxin-thioredoxin reductase catalytic subunit